MAAALRGPWRFLPKKQTAPIDDEQVIQVRLKDLEVRNARRWGGCWLVCELYGTTQSWMKLWAERWPPDARGLDWGDLILNNAYVYIVSYRARQ